MKIAIPTSDRLTVFKRTGHAKEFAICNIKDGFSEFIEFRQNPYKHDFEETPGHDHNYLDILEAIKDCDALLVWAVGPRFRNDFHDANIPLYRTLEEDLNEAIMRFSGDLLSHERL
jgi:predicted Fe-Mo cluster-binding NifX family protein